MYSHGTHRVTTFWVMASCTVTSNSCDTLVIIVILTKKPTLNIRQVTGKTLSELAAVAVAGNLFL